MRMLIKELTDIGNFPILQCEEINNHSGTGNHVKAIKLSGARKLALADAEMPQAGNKTVIRIERCGICGSDLHIWKNGAPAGLIMGHEFSGTVADPGSAGAFLEVGDRVTALPVNFCGTCPACRSRQFNRCARILADAPGITTPGAYAEYVAISTMSIRKLPGGMSMEEGAMVEPSAVALHAVNLAHVSPGDKLLIVGGGIIGLLCAAWARLGGATYIGLSEMNAKRRQKAFHYGDVDEVFDAADPQLHKTLLTATGGGFSKVIECAGPAPAVTSAIGAATSGGVVVLAGISYADVPVSTMRINMRELTLKGAYGYTLDEFDRAMDYIARKSLKTERFIDDTVRLEDVQRSFERLTDPAGDAVKIMINPRNGS